MVVIHQIKVYYSSKHVGHCHCVVYVVIVVTLCLLTTKPYSKLVLSRSKFVVSAVVSLEIICSRFSRIGELGKSRI